jgi:integrase/recombinase XerD
MRRLAEDGATTHELMAISGHRRLTEVERYNGDANMKLLADSAMAKRTKRTNDYTNSLTPVHKQTKKAR